MLIIPIQTPDHLDDALLVILDGGNVARMREADPAEIVLRQTKYKLINPTVLVCLEEPTPEFARLLQTRDVPKIVAHLQRGRKFRPDQGDHDRGPESLGDSN